MKKVLIFRFGLKIATGEQDKITVAGRGELHLAVLIEAMRREGL